MIASFRSKIYKSHHVVWPENQVETSKGLTSQEFRENIVNDVDSSKYKEKDDLNREERKREASSGAMIHLE